MPNPSDSSLLKPNLEAFKIALKEPKTVRILCELLDGRSHTAKELATVAEVGCKESIEHLSTLIDIKMIASEKSGRCTYYRLSSIGTAELLEKITPLSPTNHLYNRGNSARDQIFIARSCYAHIAGRLGVLIARSMLARKWISAEGASVRLTHKGGGNLARLGVLPTDTTYPKVKLCLDWTERRKHLSGSLGAALFRHALSQKWLSRPETGRALFIEPRGFEAFRKHFGVTSAALLRQTVQNSPLDLVGSSLQPEIDTCQICSSSRKM